MNSQRGNAVMVGLIAAILAPKIERATGVKLTSEDVAALIGLAIAGWHGVATAIERYFPPPSSPANPIQPLPAAASTKAP